MGLDCSNTFFLFVLLILECINSSVLGNPDIADNIKKGLPAVNVDDTTSNSSEMYLDDVENSAEEIRAPLLKSTPMPYFEEKTKTIDVKDQNSKVVLDCPVINYNESKHQILWYKEKNPITNGMESLKREYRVDNSFNLTIVEITDETLGNYYCSVLPQDIRRHTLVKMANVENGRDRQTVLSPSIFALIFLTILNGLVPSIRIQSVSI